MFSVRKCVYISVGVCRGDYLRSVVNVEVCPSGRELTHGHQLGLAGAVSLPVFWLAGAGTAVFWVLGECYISLSLTALRLQGNQMYYQLLMQYRKY